MHHEVQAKGKVLSVLGNLLTVEFEGPIAQGEVALIQLESESLKAEVISIAGNTAKLQVFEDTAEIQYGTPVVFQQELLSIELGPGILGEIVDGLQNPLEKVGEATGLFLERGFYVDPIDRVKKWEYTPYAKVGDTVHRGDTLGTVRESYTTHHIMVPFLLYGTYTITWLIEKGSYPVETTIAKIRDEKGEEHEISMLQKWPVKIPLCQGHKVPPSVPMTTGMRIIDTMIPVAKGGTACNPGPFGSGKTVTQQSIAKFSDVDIVVLVACGERAGEVVEVLRTFPQLTDVHTNQPLMQRTAIICNTSSMPVAAREASVYVGMTIGEYYRQMGLDVLVLADSTSRWAQAMREISGLLEEIPGDEAFPAYLASRIKAFYERAGVIDIDSNYYASERSVPKEKVNNMDHMKGSVTVIGAVSPSGGNISADPVSQATLSVVGAFICLSRELSDARIYPAIDALKSWSTYVPVFAKAMEGRAPQWEKWVEETKELLLKADEIGRRMEVVGTEGMHLDDIVLYYKSALFSFCYLQQNAFDKTDRYCPQDKQQKMFTLINEVFETEFAFNDVDEAKQFFNRLQYSIKNLNFISFPSEEFQNALVQIEESLGKAETVS